MKKTVLIMAGGRGERFWPKSRKSAPKQFISLTTDGKTMIQHTVERILPMVDVADIYIATNKMYKKLVLEQLPGILEENILCEPVGRNTAPCIGLAAVHMHHKYEDSIMIVLPSDHLVKNENLFIDTLTDACEAAEINTNLITIGITPTYPETGYGYIRFVPKHESKHEHRAYSVEKIIEKPTRDKAKEYCASGNYLWNSGMFVWKTSSILTNIERHLPNIFDGLMNINGSIGTEDYERVLDKEFDSFTSDSIDYGVMEKADNIYTIPGTFGWDDVGSWLALERINDSDEFGNNVLGNAISIKTKNCIISAQSKLIATVGLEDIIIIDTEDATLICSKTNSQDVKSITENLRICNRYQYL